ncbi:MAG: prepilin-type N-terminal cleavage/methylation domain-containing protein [Bdellovibrio sp.]|nr:prepilin-type N-terminal cleavage/methylation domain-containing protein [Bdellovibrio sp.]
MILTQANSKKGFSLIEVLLAITILSTLMVLSSQALSRALKAKVKIQAEVDDASSLRDTMRLIRTDLNLAFHYRDVEKEISDIVAKPKAVNGLATPTAPTPAVPRENKREDPVTDFDGAEDKMNFVTSNNGRTTANALQADFVEVGYSLKDCKNLTDPSKSSKCLFRRIQSVIDNDVTEGGTESVLLENVSEFKLRYFGEGKQDFVSTWQTKGNDGATKGRYPEVVEVTLGISHEVDKKKKTYSMQFVVPIHFPNNPPPTSTATSNGMPASPTGVVPGT